MVTETRYMRGDQQTVNGLLAYILGISQSDTQKHHSSSGVGAYDWRWGIRVWKRSSAEVETEITGGSPVAIVSRVADGEGIQSNTWECPQTSLDGIDAIVVRVYDSFQSGSWVLCDKFITEQIGASQLDSATWTVYYYTYYKYWAFLDAVDGGFYWGTDAKNSRIGNFMWSIVPPPPPAKPLINKPLVNPILINQPMIR